MDISQQILSDLVVFNKYAKYIDEIQRRETWEEICERNLAMHIRKFPQLKEELKNVYRKYVFTKKVFPSMRSLQFGGLPIELSNSRIFNCAFQNADTHLVFNETMFNLLSGSGVGYSVQSRHVSKLPIVTGPGHKRRKFLIGDSIEGWADAVKVLVKAYMYGKSDPVFDYRDIRQKGAKLVTSGGKAPGPDPLRICLDKIRSVLNGSIGRQLKSIEVHDILCHIADAVLSGGIRRAAMICLFDKNDMDMLYAKSGDWWELNPQRGRANNSVILKRGDVTKQEWDIIWNVVKNSGSGEPGIVWTDDLDSGVNPCAEIGLRSKQFCNLTTQNVSDVSSQDELEEMCRAAALIGTVQASYTDFHYLSPEWKENSDEEALIGVSMTGIASGTVLKLDIAAAAKAVLDENYRVAKILGINPAARATCIKPEGTASCVAGSSSGIHAWHNDYYIRRMRIGKNEPIYKFLMDNIPELVEDCVFKPHIDAVVSIPQKAPIGAITRDENVFDMLERIKLFNERWIRPGHRSGVQSHNVSATVSIKENEWFSVGEWMWENKDYFTGISVLPYDGHTYQQAPFEDCTKEKFEEMFALLKNVDFSSIVESENNTNLSGELACSGGACTVT